MTNLPDREMVVFNTARRLPAGDRAPYLDETCRGDAALQQRVEELLQASDAAGGFLESPAAMPLTLGGAIHLHLQPAEKPGDWIGHYKLLQQIGEGGCGVVYMAEQEKPVRRRVALKVIKLGMDTKQVITRFEAERQALALMDHPNIAKVLDAGATDTGRPYFIMELVRGIKITDYCDQNNLSPHKRLELFIQVCQAVQHAHQKGIIHRDIKPSNILVTMNDGLPLPKVIDFGIAKATHGKLTDQTLFTAFEQFIGTPAYMSPEQAEMSAQDIDTRSDIYSLGVLLYELLTGQTPFDAKKLLQASLDEIRHTIREQEPSRPSTRLSTMLAGELTNTARQRHTDPPKLIHLVRGDLDWIVMKALEKNRTRRYETANGLAADIRRYLDNEPVIARPPSNFYKLQKLVRRNELIFIAVGAVMVALVIGLGIATWMFFQEQQARRQAEAQRQIAEMEAAKSRQVASFLQDMLEGVGPEKALGRDTTMLQEILSQTQQRLGRELQNQPAVEAELRATIGGAYQQLGELAEAETQYRQALQLQESVSGKYSAMAMPIANALAETMIDQGELADAEAIIREKLARSQQHFGPVHSDVANSLHELAVVLWKRGELAEADRTLRQALAQFRQLQDQMEISAVLGDLGLLQLDCGDLSGATGTLSEALEIRQKLLPPEDPRRVLAGSNLALALWYEGDLAGAEALDREALEMDRKLYRAGSPNTAAVLNNLANVLRDRGDFAAAEPIQRECLAMVEKTMGQEDPHATIARKNLAMLLRRYGSATADSDKLREALKLDPTDAMTADALMNLLADPFLTPVAASLGTAAPYWRWTVTPPASNWMQADFSDAVWTSSVIVAGTPTYVPHSYKNPINNHTNLWLRREFELTAVPLGNLVFRINHNHDAQIFLNGIEVVPTADWSDTELAVIIAGASRAALRTGRNLLAVHCTDADAAAPIDVRIYLAKNPGTGKQKMIEEFGRMIGNESGRSQLYVGRADIYARREQWHEAAVDLAKAIELEPTESTSWYQLAPLFLEMDDRSDYDRHRTQALTRFLKTNDPVVGARIAFLALLVPAMDDDLANALKLADSAALAEYPDVYLGWRQLVKGLAEYRRGQFTNSVAWMEKALATAGQPNLPGWSHELERNRKATAYLVESMAYFQMHNPLGAQAALGQATEIIEKKFPSIDSGDVGRDWPGWIAAHLLLREAQMLIQK